MFLRWNDDVLDISFEEKGGLHYDTKVMDLRRLEDGAPIYVEKGIAKISEILETKCLYSVIIISHGLLVYYQYLIREKAQTNLCFFPLLLLNYERGGYINISNG